MRQRDMITTHPEVGAPSEAMLAFVQSAFDCAQTCTSCADACLAEEMVSNLRQCIRLNLDCADLCDAAGRLGSRRTGSNREVLAEAIQACLAACRACGDECAKHAEMHAHCKVCAEACRDCAAACEAALKEV